MCKKREEGFLTDDNELRRELAKCRGQSNDLGVTLKEFLPWLCCVTLGEVFNLSGLLLGV